MRRPGLESKFLGVSELRRDRPHRPRRWVPVACDTGNLLGSTWLDSLVKEPREKNTRLHY